MTGVSTGVTNGNADDCVPQCEAARAIVSTRPPAQDEFFEELRAALDFYLDLPPDFDEKALAALVREANASMDRSIAKLDETLTFLEKFREAKTNIHSRGYW